MRQIWQPTYKQPQEWVKTHHLLTILLQIFKGNSGRKDTVRHDLVENVKAQFVRFQPVQYSTHKALRVAVYGTKIPAGNSDIAFTQWYAALMLSVPEYEYKLFLLWKSFKDSWWKASYWGRVVLLLVTSHQVTETGDKTPTEDLLLYTLRTSFVFTSAKKYFWFRRTCY